MNRIFRSVFCLVLLIGGTSSARADSIVVFNEIMYHPATNEAQREWVELYNQNAVDVDLSGWRLVDGVDYTFPDGAVIRGGGYVVVAIAPSLLTAEGVTNVFGPFTGRLANDGEKLQLRDNAGRVMDAVNFGVDGEWPLGPDGAGISLAKRGRNLASNAAENWGSSSRMGGSPGWSNSIAAIQSVVLNEISGASSTDFWVELQNNSNAPVELSGLELQIQGSTPASYVLSPASLAAGGQLQVAAAALQFNAAPDDRIFLYSPGRQTLFDAVSVKTTGRARFPDGSGDWRYPANPTPGGTNDVRLRSDIVINELMYHAAPLDAVPATTSNYVLKAIGGIWRYRDTGVDLGTTWRGAGYDDSAWPSGAGLFYYNAANLPAATNTALAANRTTYYFRTQFNLTDLNTNVTLDLRAIIDDGAVFYVNGTEVFRQNMPTGTVTYATLAAPSVGVATYSSAIVIPSSQFVLGVNVLAVEVHQAANVTGASGLTLSGGGLALAEEGPFNGTVPPNLARQAASTPFVIDSLAGYAIHDYTHLNDGVYGNSYSWIGNSGSPGYAGIRFNGLFTVQSIAFGRDNTGGFSDRTLGTYTLQYTQVASPGTGTTVTGNPATGWATIGTLNYQNAGTGLFTAPSRRHRFTFNPVSATAIRLLVPATGLGGGTCIDELEVNPPDISNDIAFGAELSLTTTFTPAQPYRTVTEEWMELYNRSTNAVDLTGWRLDAGIDYRFTNGPVLPPNGYLVVANNAVELRAKWPEVANQIVGDFSGKLAGYERVLLRDALGNPVAEIRVFAGGWSDGGGSSLELRDPNSDSLSPDAWADSNEISRGRWQTNTYRMIAGQNYGSTRWNEFRVGLLDAGEVLMDDVSVVRDPDGVREQLLQNGSFGITNGNTHWRWLGNHASAFVTDPDSAANPVLKITSDGRAVMNHNHVETTFLNNAALINGQQYEVSYRARWLAGSPQLSTRAYFAKLANVTALNMPSRSGTPGIVNSRWIANAGPTFTTLTHQPIIPAANQSVLISVRVRDPNAVASASLNYRINPATTFTIIPMSLQSTGAWTATIPGQTAGKIVQFYVVATDALEASATAPSAGPASRALYQVADAQGAALPTHELRLIMLDADRDFMLHPTNVMSNARNLATLIHDRTEVYYDVGARLQGTAASRIRDGDNYVSYDIEFPPGQPFRGQQNNIGIDRSGRSPTIRGQDEIGIQQMFHRAAVPCQYSDLCYFISPRTIHTGTAILQLAGYDKNFVTEQFDQDGSVFNMDITYEPDTTTDGGVESIKLPVPLESPQYGTDLTDLGAKEQYRAPFDIRVGNRRDDYTGLMRLCQTMALPQSQFDAQISTALDVNAVLRMVALEILCGIGDTYINPGQQNPHNLRIFAPVAGGPAVFLPWDMDFAYAESTSASIFPGSGYHLSKLVNNANYRRWYLYHVNDLCQSAYKPTYINPWLTHYGSVVAQNFTGASSYISSRRNYALSQLPAASAFAITSNNGNNFTTNTSGITLAGSGWIDVRDIEVNGIPYPVVWTSSTAWSLYFPLASGLNQLAVQGVDRAGLRRSDLVDTITITNTAVVGRQPIMINEWMADNMGPGGFADSADGLYQDWFELYNPNPAAVDLSGFYLTDDLANRTQFAIPTNTLIAPHGFLVVWADENGSQNSPTQPDLHANFKLSNDGEQIGLFGRDSLTLEDQLTFGPQYPNISQGRFPDGAATPFALMTNWSPRATNRLGYVPAPSVKAINVNNGTLTFSHTASPGHKYEIQYCDDLTTAIWNPTSSPRTATNEFMLHVETIANTPRRFYRSRLE